jgi:hypothetical protein
MIRVYHVLVPANTTPAADSFSSFFAVFTDNEQDFEHETPAKDREQAFRFASNFASNPTNSFAGVVEVRPSGRTFTRVFAFEAA